MPEPINGVSAHLSGQGTGIRLPLQIVHASFWLLLVVLILATGTSAAAVIPSAVHVGDPHHPGALSAAVQKASDAQLADFIENGGPQKKAMHAFANKGVSGAEAQKLAAYVKTLK